MLHFPDFLNSREPANSREIQTILGKSREYPYTNILLVFLVIMKIKLKSIHLEVFPKGFKILRHNWFKCLNFTFFWRVFLLTPQIGAILVGWTWLNQDILHTNDPWTAIISKMQFSRYLPVIHQQGGMAEIAKHQSESAVLPSRWIPRRYL